MLFDMVEVFFIFFIPLVAGAFILLMLASKGPAEIDLRNFPHSAELWTL